MTDPVLIAGAGPAGLFAACELLRHGVRPCLVERREAPHHEARGTVLQPAVLEVLGRAGVLDPFLRDGVHVRHAQLLVPDYGNSPAMTLAAPDAPMTFSAASHNGSRSRSSARIWRRRASEWSSAPR